MMHPLSRKLKLLVGRCVLQAVNADNGMQMVKVSGLDGEVADLLEHFQQYGLTSVPKAGAEGIRMSIGGDRSHGVVFNIDDRRYRLKGLKTGEVALYTDEGDTFIFKRGNKVELNTKEFTINATTKIHFETPELTVSGDITDQSDINDNTIGNLRTTYNGHTHTGDNGGTTSAPHQTLGGS